jgi:hypothetical protein
MCQKMVGTHINAGTHFLFFFGEHGHTLISTRTVALSVEGTLSCWLIIGWQAHDPCKIESNQ